MKLDKDLKMKIFKDMLTARVMEERMVTMFKSGKGFFWLGGLGEEAFNVVMGTLAKRMPDKEDDPDANPLDYDFFHFHYRNGATMVALGMDPIDELRQMANRDTDPFSKGRNFCNHYARKAWNVVPVASTIQTQCSIAPGTALAQGRHGGDGLTIVTFGDAGTAEGDMHVGLNWATNPVKKMPLLFICTNNEYGISTPYEEVHGQKSLTELAAGYGMKTATCDGNDVAESFKALKKAMDYCRKERKPYFLEAKVSRLYGHSSSSGANRIPEGEEVDPLDRYREQLIEEGLLTQDDYDKAHADEVKLMKKKVDQVLDEPAPDGDSIYKYIFAE